MITKHKLGQIYAKTKKTSQKDFNIVVREFIKMTLSKVKDVKGFLAKIMKGRGIVQGRVSLGMGGGKKLLIGCSLYDEVNPANNWLEGGVKASSYKTWLLLASVDKVPENYHNIKLIMQSLCFPFNLGPRTTFSGDYKLVAIGRLP